MKRGLLTLAGIVAALLALVAYNLLQPAASHRVVATAYYSDVVQAVEAGRVVGAVLSGNQATMRYDDGREVAVFLPKDDSLLPRLLAHHAQVSVSPAEEDFPLLRVLIAWLPTLLLLGILVHFLRRVAQALTAMTTAVTALQSSVASDRRLRDP